TQCSRSCVMVDVLLLGYYFFFSSRRRHTRFSRDWSSDVCSSDLVQIKSDLTDAIGLLPTVYTGGSGKEVGRATKYAAMALLATRSEERRVGKECRCRVGTYREKS